MNVNVDHLVPPATSIFEASFHGLMTVITNSVREHGECCLWVEVSLGRWSCDNGLETYISPLSDSNVTAVVMVDSLTKAGWTINLSEDGITVSFSNITSSVVEEVEND